MGESKGGVLWFISFLFANAAQAIISPLTPLFILSLKGTVVDVGLVSAVYNLMVVPASIFWGRLSERIGKRKVFILIGMLSSPVIIGAFSMVQSVLQLLLLNALLGFFLTAYVPVASMLIADVYPKARWGRFIAQYNLFNLIGGVSGIILGSLWFSLFHFGMRELFVFSSALFMSGFVASAVLISDPEGLREKGKEIHLDRLYESFYKALKEPFKGVRRHEFTVFLIFVVMIFTAYNACYVTLPVYYNSFGISEGNIFLLFLLGPSSAMASNFITGLLATRLGEKRLMICAATLRGLTAINFAPLGILIEAVTQKTVAFALNMALWGTTWSLLWVPASTIVLNMGAGSRLGTVQGAYNAFTGVATVIGSLIGGVIPYFYGFPQHFLLSGAIALIGVLFFVVGAREHEYQ